MHATVFSPIARAPRRTLRCKDGVHCREGLHYGTSIDFETRDGVRPTSLLVLASDVRPPLVIAADSDRPALAPGSRRTHVHCTFRYTAGRGQANACPARLPLLRAYFRAAQVRVARSSVRAARRCSDPRTFSDAYVAWRTFTADSLAARSSLHVPFGRVF